MKLEAITLTSLQRFIDLCSQYLSGDLSSKSFADTFEMYMFDYGDEVEEETYILLDTILEAVTYYDTDSTREDDERFMEEAELRAIVRGNLEKIRR
jgi:hypothetical protein